MNITTGRPVTMAPSGMVTCPHALASQAGVDVLRAGGSAVDAAIAASAALAVLYPHMTGVGGDAFWLIYDAKNNKVRYLDGGGRAAASATCGMVRERGHGEVPFRGILPATLTTPGAVASWCEAHARVRPAAAAARSGDGDRLCARGFPGHRAPGGWIRRPPRAGAACRSGRDFPARGQRCRAPASTLINPDLARTLKRCGDGGRAGFYDGDVGARTGAVLERRTAASSTPRT